MKKNLFFIGLDISKADFAASIYKTPKEPIVTKEAIPNERKGFEMLLLWLNDYHIDKKNCRICMEATGVYSQAISYYLLFQGFPVSVEPPLKVKRAFDPVGHKTDPVDSKQIAEYAYRFQDELTSWQPRDEILEKIRQLLSVREQFTKQKVALKNAIQVYHKQRVQVALIKKAHQETLAQLKKQIARIDKELAKLINQDPGTFQKASNLKSIPGYGMLLAAHLLVITENFTKIQNYKRTLLRFKTTNDWLLLSVSYPTSIKAEPLCVKGRKFATLDLCQAVNSCGWLLNRWPPMIRPLDAIIYVKLPRVKPKL